MSAGWAGSPAPVVVVVVVVIVVGWSGHNVHIRPIDSRGPGVITACTLNDSQY